jgi:hypothetical protein
LNSNYNNDDDKYWKCEIDKAGNGYAIIRFLPVPPQDGEEALPFVKYYDHGFQGVGGWYIEKSLTTLGKEDPLSEYNSQLWSSGIEANKEIARKQKRRLHYVSNIYVVKDPKNPENEGKVFLFKYGKKIMEKLTGAMNPQFEDETPFDPFNFWTGANLKLKIRKVDGYQNYDSSEFDDIGPLDEDDDVMASIWNQEHSLLEIISEKNVKTYDELKTKLDRVLGVSSPNVSRTNTMNSVKSQRIEEKEQEVDRVFSTPSLSTDEDEEFDFASLLGED